MSFRLRADESVVAGVRRALRREAKKAVARLRGLGPAGTEEVHDARKRFKKARALLKLARKGLGARAYDRENACFRDAGKPLTEVRDAEVLLETLDGLGKHHPRKLDADSLRPVREALIARRAAIRERVLGDGRTAADVVKAVEGARRRLKGQTFRRGGWALLAAGLRQTYTRGQRAFARAAAAQTVENLHEWRKRVKDLWHQLQFLQDACPSTLGEWADRAHDLGDALGDDHDLAVFAEVVSHHLTPAGGEDGRERLLPVVERLLPLIERRRAELQQKARALGGQVYADPPNVFVGRLRSLWKAWRTDPARAEAACRT